MSLGTTDPQLDVLSWEETEEVFYAEEISGFESPLVWMPLLDAGEFSGGRRRITVPKQAGMRFYQLRRDLDLDELLLEHALSQAADLPLQTRASDACPDVPFLDRFNPDRWSPLVGVPRTLEGGFVLVPGRWQVELESYCLKMGTPSPEEGDGYLPAAMWGPRADIIAKVIREASLDPGVEQESAQILLWAIILRTPLHTLPPALQTLAARWLTADELDRLAVASALKARQSEAYARRFAIFLNKAVVDLPVAVRKELQWDSMIQEAMAQAGELAYEDIQNLAFAATAPPVPTEPGREIAYGRWAWMPATEAPPGGYLIRYLVGFYAETMVQVCVPETITVESDVLGRITRIADLEGMELRTVYDDAVPALAVEGDPGVKGYAFGTIQAAGPPDPEDPRRLLTASHAGIGWTLVGALAGGGTTRNEGRYNDAAPRYAWALAQKAELQRLDRELTRVHSGRAAGSDASAARLLNLANYCEGLRLAFAQVPEDDPAFPLLPERLGLAYRAWIAEFAVFARSQSGALAGTQSAKGCPQADDGRPGPVLAGDAPRPQPDLLDRTVFRLFDWMFGTRQYQAMPSGSGRQNLGLAGRITGALKNWWNQNFAGHQKHSTVVKTTFRFSGMPSFLAIPQKIIEKLIATNVELYRYAGDVIANAGADPPRRFKPGRSLAAGEGITLVRTDYTVPTVEQVWDPGPLEAGPGISVDRLTRAQVLQDHLLELAAHLHAAVLAIQRQVGALDAGDAAWYTRQGAYAVHHVRKAGALMWDTADAIEAMTRVLVEEGVEDPWVTREEFEGVVARLRAEGYTAEERAMLKHLGLSDEEIAVCLASAAETVMESDGVGAWGSLVDYAGTLRELGSVFMQFPVAFPMEGN